MVRETTAALQCDMACASFTSNLNKPHATEQVYQSICCHSKLAGLLVSVVRETSFCEIKLGLSK